jgi:hypothetical protein
MKEVSVQLQCVVLQGQIEKWLEYDKAEVIRNAVKRGDRFVEIGGELINTNAVVGVFNALTMADKIRNEGMTEEARKNLFGQTAASVKPA